MLEAATGWYSQIMPGQAFLEKDLSLGDREEKIIVVLARAQATRGYYTRPAWRVLVRDLAGRVWVKDVHFFGGNPRRIY